MFASNMAKIKQNMPHKEPNHTKFWKEPTPETSCLGLSNTYVHQTMDKALISV